MKEEEASFLLLQGQEDSNVSNDKVFGTPWLWLKLGLPDPMVNS